MSITGHLTHLRGMVVDYDGAEPHKFMKDACSDAAAAKRHIISSSLIDDLELVALLYVDDFAMAWQPLLVHGQDPNGGRRRQALSTLSQLETALLKAMPVVRPRTA